MLAGGACMITETDFPRSLFEAYAEGKLTRNAFESYFSEWQKKHGMNFDCKGSADSKGVYVQESDHTGRFACLVRWNQARKVWQETA